MTNQHPTPQSLFDLFISFTLIALQGFGGVVAIIQREIVEKKRWMTKEEFVEEWAVAQIMPGPNVVNLSMMIGARYFGLRGAFAALAGMLLVPMIIALTLCVLYAEFSTYPVVAGAMRGMSAVAAGLIIATGIKLFASLKSNPMGKIVCIAFCVVCFVCIALLRWPLVSVILVLGALAWLVAYRALRVVKS